MKWKKNSFNNKKLVFPVIRKNNVDNYTMEQLSGLEKSKLDAITGKKLLDDSKFLVRIQVLLFLLLFSNIMISTALNNTF